MQPLCFKCRAWRIAFGLGLCEVWTMFARRTLVTLLLAALGSFSGCSDPVSTVRDARIAPDQSVTIAQALERYPYFKGITWSTYVTKDQKRIVEAACDIDVAANCRGVNEAGLKLAQRDVTSNYFLARFLVEGWPPKVRALEAQHVTQCTNGARLGFADAKYLHAIYNREQVRFFCLDGLNCPGQGSQSQDSLKQDPTKQDPGAPPQQAPPPPQ